MGADLSDNSATISLPATDAAAAPPIGAVLVVGGGIAGMQASLDLADQGFRVHLVESKSAIGGHMAQLDKTFPTNDCAMCTISPKLVETGRHLNIDLHVDSEVVAVDGQAGNFTVTLRHKPRYIDPLKCVGCGDCADVCPVVVPDPFNEALSPRRAAFKLYPQAVPNAYAIEKLGVSPCRDACPAGQRAQGYIALIREGRFADALRVIKEDNPFPGICGRICNHRCEDACNRGLIDEPVNIRALKRFVTDRVYAEPRTPLAPAERKYEAPVAIIGAGPCGLTTAQDLARLGYPVTVFEALPVAGGMLRVGVPEYRLPAEIIEREVADILDLGIDLRLNTRVDDLDGLFEQGYQAVLVAVGAHEGVRLPLPGADLPGVLVNTHFLRDVRLGLYSRVDGQVLTPDGQPFGPRVLVLGGGNVAIDVARSAIRLGAHVELACVEPRDRMPCHPWEAEAAEAEGVVLHPGRSFLSDPRGRRRAGRRRRVLARHRVLLRPGRSPVGRHRARFGTRPRGGHDHLFRRSARRSGLHPRRRRRRHHPTANDRHQPQHDGGHPTGRLRRRRQRLRARRSSSRPSPPATRRPRASTATCRARRSSLCPSRTCRW